MNASHHVAAVKSLDIEISRLEAQRKVHTDALIEAANKQTGKFTVDTGSYTISENNTYSKAAMMNLLKPGQFQRVSNRVIVPAMVKSAYPDIYEASKERKGYKVSVG